MIENMLPHGSNPPRVNPEYCVGFNITFPVDYNLSYQWGDMAHIEWEVDTGMKEPPEIITRIRILDQWQLNLQVVGQNISIHTHGNKGAAKFPILASDYMGPCHYRIMVAYPNQAIHCVYESVPWAYVPRPFELFGPVDTPAPPFARANAILVK
ncbi:hypothetical protein BX666DRAFT_1625956 [Dichotomocladium elegans]|nr:hypothetical protein BX666DRAFT_1625956 [Dichotomocladium elegans]